MGFRKLQGLLQQWQRQPGWEKLKRYQEIQAAWEQVIPQTLSKQTRPMGVQRQTLTVAVASATLAQSLQLQRQSLLVQLNQQLQEPLAEIRFSPLLWYQCPPHPLTPASALAKVPPPSVVSENPHSTSVTPDSASAALTQWIQTLETRSQSESLIGESRLHSCPQCQSLVLPTELERWSVCAACARERWVQPLSQARPPAELTDNKTVSPPTPTDLPETNPPSSGQ